MMKQLPKVTQLMRAELEGNTTYLQIWVSNINRETWTFVDLRKEIYFGPSKDTAWEQSPKKPQNSAPT